MNYELSLFIIAGTVAISAAVLGVFVVTRRMSMMIDAISHTVFIRNCDRVYNRQRCQ